MNWLTLSGSPVSRGFTCPPYLLPRATIPPLHSCLPPATHRLTFTSSLCRLLRLCPRHTYLETTSPRSGTGYTLLVRCPSRARRAALPACHCWHAARGSYPHHRAAVATARCSAYRLTWDKTGAARKHAAIGRTSYHIPALRRVRLQCWHWQSWLAAAPSQHGATLLSCAFSY